MDDKLDQIHKQAFEELGAAKNAQDIQDISVRYLGRKGVLTQFLRNIAELPAEQRPRASRDRAQARQ